MWWVVPQLGPPADWIAQACAAGALAGGPGQGPLQLADLMPAGAGSSLLSLGALSPPLVSDYKKPMGAVCLCPHGFPVDVAGIVTRLCKGVLDVDSMNVLQELVLLTVAAGTLVGHTVENPGAAGACFRCGQHGHWSNACPNQG